MTTKHEGEPMNAGIEQHFIDYQPVAVDVGDTHAQAHALWAIAETRLATAERLAVVEAALENAQEHLRKAADQFAFYADEHAKKGTPEGDAKGATNMNWARVLARAALYPEHPNHG